MVRRSERPTTPPSFDFVKYAKDSDARVATARPAISLAEEAEELDSLAMRKSETRLLTRSSGVLSDDTWACTMMGAPVVVMAVDELRRLPLDHRAGFLLSLMDGTMDLETLVEVSAMGRTDAIRLVRELVEAGAVRFS